MTDSEQVPWGKGEKQPGEGDEIVPETIPLQSSGSSARSDRVPIEEWSNELVFVVYLSQIIGEGKVKASVNSA